MTQSPTGVEPSNAINVSANAVVFSVIDGRLSVLLAQLKSPTSLKGWWALPGAALTKDETVSETVRRVIKSHYAADAYIEQLAVFDSTDKATGTHAVNLAYLALAPADGSKLSATDRYHTMQWRMPGALPKLAYGHDAIIKAAIKVLNDKLARTNISRNLLPPEFTLTELQALYESILGRDLDTRNFRKKMQVSGLIKETGEKRSEVAHRPAALYRFVSHTRTFLDLP